MRIRGLLGAALLALAACSSRREPDTLVVAVAELKNEAILWHRVGVLEFLIDYGFDYGEPVAQLATSWEETSPGTWVFHLRPNVLFHDGRPFQAANAAACIDAFAASPHGAAISGRIRCEVLDPLTLRVASRSPGLDLPVYLGRIPVTPDGSVDSLGRVPHPVGTGPFLVRGFEERSELHLEANDAYWGGRPKLRRIHFREVRDSATRLLMLESGEADWAVLLPVHEIARLRAEGYGVASCRFLYNVYLVPNLEHGPCSERAVREAISLAIDREAIARVAFYGLARPAPFIFPRELPFVPAGLAEAGRDLTRARRLLEEAGWKSTGEGDARVRDGRPLEITLLTPAASFRPTWPPAAEMIRQDLAKAGLRLQIRYVEPGAWNERVESGEFELTMRGRVPPWQGDPLSYFRNEFHSQGYVNLCRFRNARFDACVDSGLEATTPEERRGALAEAQRIFAEELPVIPVVHDNAREMYATSPAVRGAESADCARTGFPGRETWIERRTP